MGTQCEYNGLVDREKASERVELDCAGTGYQ